MIPLRVPLAELADIKDPLGLRGVFMYVCGYMYSYTHTQIYIYIYIYIYVYIYIYMVPPPPLDLPFFFFETQGGSGMERRPENANFVGLSLFCSSRRLKVLRGLNLFVILKQNLGGPKTLKRLNLLEVLGNCTPNQKD